MHNGVQGHHNLHQELIPRGYQTLVHGECNHDLGGLNPSHSASRRLLAPPKVKLNLTYDHPLLATQSPLPDGPPKFKGRINPVLTRDALLNKQQRYESWVSRIEQTTAQRQREMDVAEKHQLLAIPGMARPTPTKNEAEKASEKAKEQDAIEVEERERQKLHEGMAQRFEEVIARIDAKAPVLKDPIFNSYLWKLSDGDGEILAARKKVEDARLDILNTWYKCHAYEHARYRSDNLERKRALTAARRSQNPATIRKKASRVSMPNKEDDEANNKIKEKRKSLSMTVKEILTISDEESDVESASEPEPDNGSD